MPEEEEEEEACACCADPTWVEGNELLLCDGCDHKAYHIRCLVPVLRKPPADDWMCPCCVNERASLAEPLAASSLKWMAWHAAWHAASAAVGNTEASRKAILSFNAHAAIVGDQVPPALLEACQALFMDASACATHVHQGKHDAAAKARARVARHTEAIGKLVPAAVASSLSAVATHAAQHAAHARLPQAIPRVALPTGTHATGSSFAAREELRAFDAAAAGLCAHQDYLPPLWRGTPIDMAPAAEAVKWMMWDGAWHAANERDGRVADARKALGAHHEHAAKLSTLIPIDLAEACRWLGWNAAWRAANERKGYAEDAEAARAEADEHAASLALQVPAALAASLVELASNAAWHAANKCTRGCADDAAKDRKAFDAAARQVHALCAMFPPVLPKIGPPERPPRRAPSTRRRFSSRGRAAALAAADVPALKAAARHKLRIRLARLRADAAFGALPEDEQEAWRDKPFPVRLPQAIATSTAAATTSDAPGDDDATRKTAEAEAEAALLLDVPPLQIGLPDGGLLLATFGLGGKVSLDESPEVRDAPTEGAGIADESQLAAGSTEPKRLRGELEVGDRVEAQYGAGEHELWWPGEITLIWTNGDVDVRYDDGDIEKQKPRGRVRPLRGAAARAVGKAPSALKYARHSHVAFFVGGRASQSTKAALSNVRVGMLEEGLFAAAAAEAAGAAEGTESAAAVEKAHTHVHWLVDCPAPPMGLDGPSASSAAAPSHYFALQYDFSKRAGTTNILGAVEMLPAGWDERGCPLFGLTDAERERVQALAYAAANAHAEAEERRVQERLALDKERRSKKVIGSAGTWLLEDCHLEVEGARGGRRHTKRERE